MKLVNAVIGTKVQVKKCSKYPKFGGRQGNIIGVSSSGNVLVDFGVKRIGGQPLHSGFNNFKTGTKHNAETCWYFQPNELKIVKE